MLRSIHLRCLGGIVAAAIALAACGPAATPTLPPVVITVFRQGTDAPLFGTQDTPTPPAATETPAPAPDGAPATAVPVYGPDNYPEGVNPLTGEQVGLERVARMPIAAKISNFPYAVRPQSGMSLADLVFEHLAEAGLTRFTAVYLQNDAANIGSIRSARFVDTEIAPMFGAMLVTSGSSQGTMAHLRRNAWFLGADAWRLVSEESLYNCPPLCRETPDDANTLFAGSEALRVATSAQAGTTHVGQSGFVFTESPPQGGAPLTDVMLSFSSAAHVAWRYDAASRRYTRWQENDPSGALELHTDALTNEVITARNVAVLYVNHQNNFVPEDFRDGGNCGLEIQLWTIGPAKIFRDGVMLEGRWRRDASTSMRLRLEYDDGQPLALAPGNTWFGLVTLNARPELSGTTYTVMNRVPDTRTECPVPPTETPTATPEGWVDPDATPGAGEGEPPPAETPSP